MLCVDVDASSSTSSLTSSEVLPRPVGALPLAVPPGDAVARPNAWVKTALSWSIAAALCVIECVFHWRCGFHDDRRRSSSSIFDCGDGGPFRWVPDFTEGVCRCLVALALAGLCWEVALAAGHGRVLDYVQNALIGKSGNGVYCATALAGFTMALGLWSIVVEGVLPMWAKIYLHVFEVMCETAVLACLAGICYDFVFAGSFLNAARFVNRLVLCSDNIEDHAHWGEDADTSHGHGPVEATSVNPKVGCERRRSRSDKKRAVLLWVAFLVVLSCVLFDTATGHRHVWIAAPLDVFGVICISGIAFAIVTGAAEIGLSVVSALTQFNIAALAPPFRASGPREPSETDTLLPA